MKVSETKKVGGATIIKELEFDKFDNDVVDLLVFLGFGIREEVGKKLHEKLKEKGK